MDTTALGIARFGLDLALKSTLLLAVVLLLMASVARLSAARRHLLAMLGLAGALALPLLRLAVPSISLPIVPSLLTAPPQQSVVLTPAPAAPAASEESFALSDETSAPEPLLAQVSAAPVLPVSAANESAASSRSLWRRLRRVLPGPAAAARLAVLVWLVGAAFFLARLALGFWRVRRIAVTARLLEDPEWSACADELARQLGVSRPVRLLSSPRVGVAMTAGVRRPIIVLHEGARKWPPERRRVVILHELAHIRRCDWLALLMAEIAVAVYWFHPLAWLARNQARRSCERACDDMVLGQGTKPSVYAAHLLGIARSLTAVHSAALPIMSMARPSQFEGRMRAILDPGLLRRGPSRAEKRGAALGALLVAVCLAALQPWADRPARAEAFARAPLPEFGFVPAAAASPAGEDEASEPAKKTGLKEKKSCPAVESRPAAGATVPAIQPVPSAAPFNFVLASNSRDRSGSEWYSRGMDYHNDERYDQAIAAFTKAIESGYRVPAASYNIACGYALKGDKDQAFAWLAKAKEAGFSLDHYLGSDDDLDRLRSDPRFDALRREAREKKVAEKREEARDTTRRLEDLTARGTRNGGAYYEIGKKLLNEGAYAAAAKAFQRSADLFNREGASIYNKACALSLAGEKGPALEALQKAIENGFDDVSLLKKDDDLDAIRNERKFQELESLAEDLKMPSIGFTGFFLSNQRAEWRDAARQAERIAARHPGMGRVWFNLGYAQIQGDRPEAAAEAFQKALDLKYRVPVTLYNLACAYAKQDKKDQAFDALFRALDAGFNDHGLLESDDDLDNLRRDPRFRKAVKSAEARAEKD